jgi:hypothetical protein
MPRIFYMGNLDSRFAVGRGSAHPRSENPDPFDFAQGRLWGTHLRRLIEIFAQALFKSTNTPHLYF